ncbi:hypothetical protein BD309DRAFT_967057 [Dichomitus squalens]|nr:hypothetical protein BD309DRAFT_967057 [Dichomitus squalens]
MQDYGCKTLWPAVYRIRRTGGRYIVGDDTPSASGEGFLEPTTPSRIGAGSFASVFAPPGRALVIKVVHVPGPAHAAHIEHEYHALHAVDARCGPDALFALPRALAFYDPRRSASSPSRSKAAMADGGDAMAAPRSTPGSSRPCPRGRATSWTASRPSLRRSGRAGAAAVPVRESTRLPHRRRALPPAARAVPGGFVRGGRGRRRDGRDAGADPLGRGVRRVFCERRVLPAAGAGRPAAETIRGVSLSVGWARTPGEGPLASVADRL